MVNGQTFWVLVKLEEERFEDHGRREEDGDVSVVMVGLVQQCVEVREEGVPDGEHLTTDQRHRVPAIRLLHNYNMTAWYMH